MSTSTPRGGDWLALASLCLGFFLLLVDSTIISVALPALMADLGADEGTAIWVNSSYLFAYAVPLLVAGRLGDRYGARAVYLAGLVLFILASLACGLVSGPLALVAWRVVQGLGAALMTPQSMTIIRRLFAFPALGVAMGVWASVGGVASVSGPLLGGVLVGTWGWESIFLVNVPIGLVALAAAWVWLPRAEPLRTAIPVTGVLVSGLGVFGVVAGIHGGVLPPWVPGWAAVLVGLALVGCVVFAQRGEPDRALVPVPLFRDRGFVMASVGAAMSSFTVGAAMIPVMLHLQGARGLDSMSAALVLIPMGVVCAATAPFAGRSVSARGPRFTALIGSISLAVSVLLAAVLVAASAPIWVFAAALTVFGLANAFVWAPMSVAALNSAPDRLMGAASGAFNAIKQVGAVVGSAVTAALLAVTSQGAALAALGVAALVCVLASALLGRNAVEPLGRVSGVVVHGAGRGKDLGFPTANLDFDASASVPEDGVYAGRFTLLDGPDAPVVLPALVSIGSNETFDGSARTVEAHVLDFDGDLYDRRAEVELESWIRGQVGFSSVEALVEQMRRDEVVGRAHFSASGPAGSVASAGPSAADRWNERVGGEEPRSGVLVAERAAGPVTEPYTDDVVALRQAFSAFPSGVAAIAALVDGEPVSLVVSSFSVGTSQEPPLVLFAVQLSSTTWPVLSTAPLLGVSVLGEGHAGKVRQLASTKDRENRFGGLETAVSDSGAVFLEGAPLWLECAVEHTYPAGDHEIVVLRVRGLRSDEATRPLVWHRSAFTTLADERERERVAG